MQLAAASSIGEVAAFFAGRIFIIARIERSAPLIGATCIVLAALVGHLASAGSLDEAVKLPFSTHDGFILIEGDIDGVRGVFMLDTGTPFQFFANRDFADLPDGEPVASGGAASGQRIIVYRHRNPHSITLTGGHRWDLADLRSGDLGFVGSAIGVPFLGFIGLGELRKFIFAIDYEKNVVTLFPQEPVNPCRTLQPLAVLKFYFEGEIPRLQFQIGGMAVDARLDTGAQGGLTLTRETRHQLEASGSLLPSPAANGAKRLIPAAGYQGHIFEFADLDDGGDGPDEITLGYAFLRHFCSVWDYRSETVALYSQSQ